MEIGIAIVARMRIGLVALCAYMPLGLANLSGCGDKPPAEAPDAPAGPVVSVTELPVTLRSQGSAPSGAVNIEVGQSALQVASKPVLTLNGGTLTDADRQHQELPKLIQALQAVPHASATIAAGASVPYATVASVLASAKSAGVGNVAFQVRAPSGSTPGWLAIESFDVRAKTRNDEAVPGAPPRPWSDFTSQWEAIQSACGAARTGNCALKPEKIAEGGELKIVLHAAGQGVNVEFFRLGPPPVEPAEPPPAKGSKHKAKRKARKEASKPKDVAEELENVPPATEALFQFRAQEAVTSPSAISEVVKPLCGASACNVVVQADAATPFVRVISLVGAAFPDGSPAPRLAFELP